MVVHIFQKGQVSTDLKVSISVLKFRVNVELDKSRFGGMEVGVGIGRLH